MQTTPAQQTLNRRHLLANTIAAISVLLGAIPAFAQSAPGALTCTHPLQTAPTRNFGPIVPHKASMSLANPLNPNDNSPLTILTFGDSAMWGNGLDNDHKYAYQTA